MRCPCWHQCSRFGYARDERILRNFYSTCSVFAQRKRQDFFSLPRFFVETEGGEALRLRLNPLGCCLMPNVVEILVGVLACYLLTPGGISAVFFGCSRSDDLQAGEEGGRQGLVCRRSTPVNADAVSSTPVTFELFN